MKKIYLLLFLIAFSSCEKDPYVQNEEKEEWNGIEPKFRITTLEPDELKKELRIVEMLPSFKNGNNFKADKGQEAILYDSINNIYINTKNVKKMESSNGKYHSYTFPVINPVNKNSVENLFFSLQANGTYKVFRVVYLLNENDKDNIRKGRFVELKGKTQIFEIRKGFNIPQLMEKSSFPPTCAIVTVTYCSGSQNHPGGYNPDGSNCPAHEEYSAEFCTGGDGGGGGTQSWPTYDTGTGGTGGGGGGGEPTDPGDGTCIADADGNCIDDTTTITLPPPGSVEDIYPDLFFETLGENNLQYWWTVDASDAFKIKVMNYLINEGYTAEAENFALEVCLAKEDGSLISFFPFFKYPPGSNYISLYPKLTEYLQNKMPLVKEMPVITNAIQDITNLTLSQIQEDLQWGKGPIINIRQLDNYTSDIGPDTAGLFDGNSAETLYLDIDFVNRLENEEFPDQEFEDAYLFFLGVTILHEYVHYGDYLNGNNYQYPAEEGDLFETRVYGEDVDSGTLLFKSN